MMSTKDLAEHIARLAGAELMKKASGLTDGDVSFKKHGETVTRIDREINAFIIEELQTHVPDHTIVTEEADEINGEADRHRWFVDPIDGTNNFIRHIPLYCVSIGYQQDGELSIGAIFDPIHHTLFSGQIGEGSFVDDKPLRVSSVSALDESIVFDGHGYAPEHQKQHGTILLALNQAIPTRRDVGTAALMLAYVAQGLADGLVITGTKPWDCAAGTVLVREAGGRVTNFKGEDWTPKDDMIVASNGLIHDELLNLL